VPAALTVAPGSSAASKPGSHGLTGDFSETYAELTRSHEVGLSDSASPLGDHL
jgi:hypothetical protein